MINYMDFRKSQILLQAAFSSAQGYVEWKREFASMLHAYATKNCNQPKSTCESPYCTFVFGKCRKTSLYTVLLITAKVLVERYPDVQLPIEFVVMCFPTTDVWKTVQETFFPDKRFELGETILLRELFLPVLIFVDLDKADDVEAFEDAMVTAYNDFQSGERNFMLPVMARTGTDVSLSSLLNWFVLFCLLFSLHYPGEMRGMHDAKSIAVTQAIVNAMSFSEDYTADFFSLPSKLRTLMPVVEYASGEVGVPTLARYHGKTDLVQEEAGTEFTNIYHRFARDTKYVPYVAVQRGCRAFKKYMKRYRVKKMLSYGLVTVKKYFRRKDFFKNTLQRMTSQLLPTRLQTALHDVYRDFCNETLDEKVHYDRAIQAMVSGLGTDVSPAATFAVVSGVVHDCIESGDAGLDTAQCQKYLTYYLKSRLRIVPEQTLEIRKATAAKALEGKVKVMDWNVIHPHSKITDIFVANDSKETRRMFLRQKTNIIGLLLKMDTALDEMLSADVWQEFTARYPWGINVIFIEDPRCQDLGRCSIIGGVILVNLCNPSYGPGVLYHETGHLYQYDLTDATVAINPYIDVLSQTNVLEVALNNYTYASTDNLELGAEFVTFFIGVMFGESYVDKEEYVLFRNLETLEKLIPLARYYFKRDDFEEKWAEFKERVSMRYAPSYDASTSFYSFAETLHTHEKNLGFPRMIRCVVIMSTLSRYTSYFDCLEEIQRPSSPVEE